jgi:hypothetical protein
MQKSRFARFALVYSTSVYGYAELMKFEIRKIKIYNGHKSRKKGKEKRCNEYYSNNWSNE